MQIISLEHRNEPKNWLRFALELVGRPYALREAGEPEEILAGEDLANFRLLIVPCAAFQARPEIFREIKRRMPMAQVLVHGEFDTADTLTPRRLREAGADIVLDCRVSPTKLAIVLGRCFWPEAPAQGSVAADSIRQGVRLVAPSAC